MNDRNLMFLVGGAFLVLWLAIIFFGLTVPI